MTDNAITKRRAQRATLQRAQRTPRNELDEATKALIIDLVSNGATIAELERYQGMPDAADIYAAVRKDATFKAALRQAEAELSHAIMAEAVEHVRDQVASGDVEQSRVAEVYWRVASAYAEKLAPKEYGQLVKVANDPTLGPLTVQVINYAQQEAQAIEAQATPVASLPDKSPAD